MAAHSGSEAWERAYGTLHASHRARIASILVPPKSMPIRTIIAAFANLP